MAAGRRSAARAKAPKRARERTIVIRVVSIAARPRVTVVARLRLGGRPFKILNATTGVAT
jgi:hypothetical protein